MKEQYMNKSDKRRDLFMLKGPLAKKGYDWWWHNFTGYNRSNGEPKSFFIEYFICNPARGKDNPVFGQLPANKEAGITPSYVMIKAGHWGNGARQLHNFYGINALKREKNRLALEIEDLSLQETYMSGHCSLSDQDVKDHPEYMSDAGNMSWDLK